MFRCCIKYYKLNYLPYSIYSTKYRLHGGSPILEKNEKARKACEKVTKLGMLVNGGLVIGKATAGFYGNSHALIADAVHSLSDFTSDIATLYIVKQVRKPQTNDYPYGFGKYESIGSLGVGSLLLFTSGGILYNSTLGFLHQITDHDLLHSILHYLPSVHNHGIDLSSPGPASIAIIAALGSIISKEWIYHVIVNVGRKYNSRVIIANAWHHRTDALSSIIAIIGVASSYIFGIPWTDSIAGMIVGTMVGRTAFSITKESIKDLTDHHSDTPFRNKISNIIKNVEGVKNFYKLRIRKMGPFYALDVHIVVDHLKSVTGAHRISEYVKYNIQNEIEQVTDVLVHLVPCNNIIQNNNKQDIQTNTLYFDKQRNEDDIRYDIERNIKDYKEIYSLSNVTCHYVKDKLLLDIDIIMDPNLTIKQASDICLKLEKQIKTKISDIHTIDIHLEVLNK